MDLEVAVQPRLSLQLGRRIEPRLHTIGMRMEYEWNVNGMKKMLYFIELIRYMIRELEIDLIENMDKKRVFSREN